jgi:hypothetical protein
LLSYSDAADEDGMLIFKFLFTKEGLFSGASYFDYCFLGFSFREAKGKLPKLSSPIVEDV